MSSSQLESTPPAPAALAALVAAPPNCPDCGGPLTAEQRYCLACGAPVSSLRLTFLEALRPGPAAAGGTRAGRGAAGEGPSRPADGPLRRYSAPIGLLAILLAGVLIGLLVGHWTTSSGNAGRTVVTVAAPGGSAGGESAASGSAKAAGESARGPNASGAHGKAGAGAGEGAGEHAGAESSELSKPVKANLGKLSNSTGKQHREEIEKATESLAPIETG